MTIYQLRVWLLPNPPLQFEPETDVWRDIEVDGSHTLAALHETLFDAFDRHDTHGYAFRTRNEHGIATRSYVHPQMYSGEQSWPAMDDAEIDQFLDRAIPDDVTASAKEQFRDLHKNPPKEGNAAETTLSDLDLDKSQTLFYEFDFGDAWEHHIEVQDISDGGLDSEPVVVNQQGDAPSQYPEYE
jgi:hypothetical protein